MYPIAHIGGYHVVWLKKTRELIFGIPNKVDGWHQEYGGWLGRGRRLTRLALWRLICQLTTGFEHHVSPLCPIVSFCIDLILFVFYSAHAEKQGLVMGFLDRFSQSSTVPTGIYGISFLNSDSEHLWAEMITYPRYLGIPSEFSGRLVLSFSVISLSIFFTLSCI